VHIYHICPKNQFLLKVLSASVAIRQKISDHYAIHLAYQAMATEFGILVMDVPDCKLHDGHQA